MCGDGRRDSSEECDDHNHEDGHGYTAASHVEAGSARERGSAPRGLFCVGEAASTYGMGDYLQHVAPLRKLAARAGLRREAHGQSGPAAVLRPGRRGGRELLCGWQPVSCRDTPRLAQLVLVLNEARATTRRT